MSLSHITLDMSTTSKKQLVHCSASEKVHQPHNLQYPRAVAPEFFADHIGNLTVELVLASVEISTLLIRIPPTLETLAILREAEAFPGNDPEGK